MATGLGGDDARGVFRSRIRRIGLYVNGDWYCCCCSSDAIEVSDSKIVRSFAVSAGPVNTQLSSANVSLGHVSLSVEAVETLRVRLGTRELPVRSAAGLVHDSVAPTLLEPPARFIEGVSLLFRTVGNLRIFLVGFCDVDGNVAVGSEPARAPH